MLNAAGSRRRGMEEVFNCTQVLKSSAEHLMAAPQACMLVNKLSLVTALTPDPSLVNDRKERKTFQRLKTPDSFRASLAQVANSICSSFRTADTAMGMISATLLKVPGCIEDVLEALTDNDAGTVTSMNLNLGQIAAACETCRVEAAKPTVAFQNTVLDIDELIEAATATQSYSVDEMKNLERTKRTYEAMRNAEKREAAELAELEAKQKEMVEEARSKYKEQKDRMGSLGTVFTALMMDTLSSTLQNFSSGVKTIGNFPGDALNSVKGLVNSEGKFVETVDTRRIHEIVMRRTCSELLESLKNATEKLPAKTDDLELNLTSAVNFEPKSDHGKNIKNQVKRVVTALREMKGDDPESMKQFKQAYHGLKEAVQVAEVAEEKHEQEQQKKINGAVEGTTRMMETLEKSTREAGSHYEMERRHHDDTRNRLMKSRREMDELGVKIANAERDGVDLTTVIKYLAEGATILGEVKESWLKLETFFTNIHATVKESLCSSIDMFKEAAKIENPMLAKSTKRIVVSSALKACGLATQVHNCASLYQAVSQKYVIPKIATVSKNLLLNKEEALAKLNNGDSDANVDSEIKGMIESRIKTMTSESNELMEEYSSGINKAIGL